MASITANELKTKGISLVESTLEHDGEAVITVRGKRKYVVPSRARAAQKTRPSNQ